MSKLYKILHIPTGLFWKPSKYGSKHNLTKQGKVYNSRPSLTWCTGMFGNCRIKTKEYPYYKELYASVSEFQIIEIEVKDE